MTDIWDGAYWDEDGVLHIDIFPMRPVKQDEDDTMYEDEEYEEDSEEFEDEEELEDEEEFEHTYATVDCGGECGGCVALIVDGGVVSGPPFHPHCGCSLSPQDIKNAEQHKSNLHGTVAPDRNVDTRDVEWLKKSLTQLDCYEPDTRAGESADNPNPYPNQKLFDAIEKFRKLQKIKERGAVKPGHWTEVKINQELEKKQSEKKDMENIDTNKVTDMKMSDKGIEWLKGKEDRVLDKRGNHVIYDDATKKPVNPNEPLPKGATIGYGHLVKPGEDFTNGITERQAIALLRSDIATAERAVQDNITAHMSQPQYDALVSLAYNIGASGFKNSTVVKYINNPDFHSSVYSDLESAWKAWNRTQGKVSNGLINRRQNEWNLYKRGIY